jgi:hypothetical protein
MPVTISGSTGISGVDGSAGTPALIGSDADTGIFLAAGQVSASVNGTAGNVPLVSGTAQNSTSGTSIDFTGIPSWVKRVTVMLQGVSTNGTSRVIIQIGAGSFDTSGYLGSVGATNFGAGFGIDDITAAAGVRYGSGTLCAIGSNGWIWSSSFGRSDAAVAYAAGGSRTLSGTLDRIRITTANGTDTFDAGVINIMYE